jgi:hypothetical protein
MYEIKKKLFLRISAITMAALLITLVVSSRDSVNFAKGQSSRCNNGTIEHSINILPVILIHGYYVDSGVWSDWEHSLRQEYVPFCTISFHNSDDEYGSASDHATELGQIIQKVKGLTGKIK